MTERQDPDQLGSPETEESSYDLTLFVSGASGLSAIAISHARTLCEVHLQGRYQLEVVDVNEDPRAVSGRLLATPTLRRNRPLPTRQVVGDLADTRKVLAALELTGSDPPELN